MVQRRAQIATIVFLRLMLLAAETNGDPEAMQADNQTQQEEGTATYPVQSTGAAPEEEEEPSPGILAVASQLVEFKIGVGLAVYATPVLCTVGLIGNSLAILVTFQKQNRQISCYFYMGVLAITDSIALAISLGYWAFKDIYARVLEPWKHRVICSSVFSVLASSILCGTYLILAMTVDRLIAVKYPLKAMSWCSSKRAKITSAIIILLCSLAKLPYVWVVAPVPPNYACFAFQVEQTPVVVLYYWFNSAVGCYVPFAILLTLNCLIIHALRRRNDFFVKGGSASNSSITNDISTSVSTVEFGNLEPKSIGGEKKLNDAQPQGVAAAATAVKVKEDKKGHSDGSLTRMLLMVSFSFITLTGPIYAFYVVYIFKNNLANPQTFAEYVMIGNICNQMLLTNYSINFYLYCLGGTKFRNDLKRTVVALCK